MITSLLDEILPDSRYKPHANLITYVQDRPGHDRRYAMNISKIQRELGWTPKHNLSTGLQATVEWYLSNQAWLKKLIVKEEFNAWILNNYSQRGGKK